VGPQFNAQQPHRYVTRASVSFARSIADVLEPCNRPNFRTLCLDKKSPLLISEINCSFVVISGYVEIIGMDGAAPTTERGVPYAVGQGEDGSTDTTVVRRVPEWPRSSHPTVGFRRRRTHDLNCAEPAYCPMSVCRV
jgi:hypothetical protein